MRLRRFRTWTYAHSFTKSRAFRADLGRVCLGLTVHRHHYPAGGLRVVVQPSIIVDVKQ